MASTDQHPPAASRNQATATEAGSLPPRGAVAPLPRGATLDRYVVLEVVGAGSMGVVYAAFDPQLDRRVALKVVHPARWGSGDREAVQQRLRHEAQALARLNHPHVVAVHDVGVVGGQLYLTTELVAGTNLADWLAAAERSTREIVGVFLQAGRGLEAAHRAGLVHRDVKPGNVMVGNDGRTRMVDFGLARGGADLPPPLAPSGRPASSDAAQIDDPAPSSVVGTPAFAAPEQLAGRPVTAAADQFSFCVALYGALHHQPPFEADATSRLDDPDAWTLRPPASRLPAQVRRLLRRGLAFHPQDRYPSMVDVLRVLDRVQRPAYRQWLIVGGVLAVCALLLTPAMTRRLERLERCRSGADRFAAVWSASRADAIARRVADDDRAFAASRWQTAYSDLDAFGAAWSRMHDEACRATVIEGRQSDALLDARMACLDQSLQEVDALTRVLATSSTWVGLSRRPTSGLTPVSSCADARGLLGPVAASADQRPQVAALRTRLAEARARWAAGDYGDGYRQIVDLVADAESAAHAPTLAETWLLRARFEESRSEADAAEESLRHAVEVGSAGGHRRVVAEAFVRGVRVAGYLRNDLPTGERRADLAATALTRLADVPELDATLADHRGLLRFQAGDYAEALGHHQGALARRTAAFGEAHPSIAPTLTRIGNALVEAGDLDEAEAAFVAALDLRHQHLGEGHPESARLLTQLGLVALERNDVELARNRLADAHARTAAALGDTHPDTATSLTYLGHALVAAGQPGEAVDRYEQAWSILERAFGRDDARLAVVASGLGGAALATGDLERARQAYLQALRLREAELGPTHPAVAETAFNVGEIAKRQGSHEGALQAFRRALAIWDTAEGGPPFLIAVGLTGVGESLLALGRPGEASPFLERALRLQPQGRHPKFLAKTQFALARCLDTLGVDAERARSLARKAEQGFERSGPASQADRTAVAAWLRLRTAPH